jgi:hypothetical protein
MERRKKGVSGVAPVARGMKGFLDPPIGRNGDSPSAPNGNLILSVHHIISGKSEFFDSIDPHQTSAATKLAMQQLPKWP